MLRQETVQIVTHCRTRVLHQLLPEVVIYPECPLRDHRRLPKSAAQLAVSRLNGFQDGAHGQRTAREPSLRRPRPRP